MESPNELDQFQIIKVEVVNKLKKHKIPYESWGTGATKTVDHLVGEVIKGESALEENEEGQLVRKLAVVWVNVYYKTSIGERYHLREDRQIFKDGRKRIRSLEGSVAEKLQAGENPDELSVLRALGEELGINSVESSEVKSESVTLGDSSSFPGLLREMKNYYFDVEISEDEYKPEGYTENQTDKDSYFVW